MQHAPERAAGQQQVPLRELTIELALTIALAALVMSISACAGGCGGPDASSPGPVGPVDPTPPAPAPSGPEPLLVEVAEARALAFYVPARGETRVYRRPGDCPVGATVLADERAYTFPRGATDIAVSGTGKTICFVLRGVVHCHVSGTSTGFCSDWADNIANVVEWDQLSTPDGRFLRGYLGKAVAQLPRPKINVSGHSQGGPDVAQAAKLLGAGDQLTLLQPAASALYLAGDMHAALDRGAIVNIAWTDGDEASIGIRQINVLAKLELIQLDKNVSDRDEGCGVRLHNAPNARHLYMERLRLPAGYTINPALDASIIANPGSPCLERGNIVLSCPAKVPWVCPGWVE